MLQQIRRRLALCGWRSLLLRALVLAAGWVVLTEAEPSGFGFGAAVVTLALLAGLLLPASRAPRWSVPGLVRFAAVFVIGSLEGGVDVARRALAPGLPLTPAVVRYPLRLPAGPARNLFMGTLSLMPGTLSVDLDGADLAVHVLVGSIDEVTRRCRELEAHVARALGETLERSDA